MTTTPPRGLPTRYRRIGLSTLYEGVEYKDFWEGKSRVRLDKLERILVDTLLPARGKRLVDIGCGFGRLAECYLGRFGQVVMLDGSLSLLKQARETTKGQAFYVAADAYHLPFQAGVFDCTLMIRVFQHLDSTERVLSEIRRILQDLGIFIFNYSNKRSARQLIKWMIARRIGNPMTLETDGIGTFFISHHPAYVDRSLGEAGFSNTEYRGEGFINRLVHQYASTRKGRYLIESLISHLGRIKMAPWVMCRSIANPKSSVPSQ